MNDQPNDPKKPANLLWRCDALTNWVRATILVVWCGWFFLVLLPITVSVAAAQMKAQQSHPHGEDDHTYYNLVGDVVKAAWLWTGVCVVLPAIVLLIVIWLQLRRLRKRIAQEM